MKSAIHTPAERLSSAHHSCDGFIFNKLRKDRAERCTERLVVTLTATHLGQGRRRTHGLNTPSVASTHRSCTCPRPGCNRCRSRTRRSAYGRRSHGHKGSGTGRAPPSARRLARSRYKLCHCQGNLLRCSTRTNY
jgi:hypothetical protein